MPEHWFVTETDDGKYRCEICESDFDEYRSVVSHAQSSGGEHGTPHKLPKEDGEEPPEEEETAAPLQSADKVEAQEELDFDTIANHANLSVIVEEVGGVYEVTFQFGRDELKGILLDDEKPVELRKKILDLLME